MKIQRCTYCDQPTGRCEEDSLLIEPEIPSGDSYGPLCEECFEERQNPPDTRADEVARYLSFLQRPNQVKE